LISSNWPAGNFANVNNNGNANNNNASNSNGVRPDSTTINIVLKITHDGNGEGNVILAE